MLEPDNPAIVRATDCRHTPVKAARTRSRAQERPAPPRCADRPHATSADRARNASSPHQPPPARIPVGHEAPARYRGGAPRGIGGRRRPECASAAQRQGRGQPAPPRSTRRRRPRRPPPKPPRPSPLRPLPRADRRVATPATPPPDVVAPAWCSWPRRTQPEPAPGAGGARPSRRRRRRRRAEPRSADSPTRSEAATAAPEAEEEAIEAPEEVREIAAEEATGARRRRRRGRRGRGRRDADEISETPLKRADATATTRRRPMATGRTTTPSAGCSRRRCLRIAPSTAPAAPTVCGQWRRGRRSIGRRSARHRRPRPREPGA